MDKLPVGQLPDLASSNNDDEIMVITNSEYNQLKKEKISDLITDFTSTNENNALTKGTDGKMFVTDFGNASNITEGTLPTSVLPEIPLEKIPDIPKDKLPPIETADLPVSGVTADTYAYPSSVTVNSQGQVTAIEEGTPSGANADTDLSNLTEEGEKHFLNKTQITNCILEAPNGVATYSGSTITVKAGLKVLIPNGRNADGTLNNIELTLQQDIVKTNTTVDESQIRSLFLYENLEITLTNDQNIIISDEKPTSLPEPRNGGVWLNTKENKYYTCARPVDTEGIPDWQPTTGLFIAGGITQTSSGYTSLTPYQPVELLKRSDKAEITGWGLPDYSAGIMYIDPNSTSVGITEQSFTVSCDGVINVNLFGFYNNHAYLYIDETLIGDLTTNTNTQSVCVLSGQYNVSQNSTVRYKLGYGSSGSSGAFGKQLLIFYPFKGANQ